MTLLIMAAGNGSRYGALKQFDELGPQKEFLFEFSISDAISNGFDHIVIITKAQFVSEIGTYLKDRLPANIKIDVLAQKIDDLPKGVANTFSREKPWGTAHAVWTARNLITNNFVVINADDYYGAPAFVSAANFMKNNTSADQFSLVAYSLKDTLSDFGHVSRGICKAEDTSLIDIKELTKIEQHKDGSIIDNDSGTALTGNEPVSMNFWICTPTIFDETETKFANFLKDATAVEKGELYLPFIIQEMMVDKIITVDIAKTTSPWFGVTYAQDKENAVQTLADKTNNNEYSSPLWNN